MIAHASHVQPFEAVGLFGGSAIGDVRRRIPLPNIAGTKLFLAEPYAQFQALRQFAAEGLVPLAVYHSHPGGGVQLSSHDVLFARQLPYLQVVVALGRAHNPAVEVAAYAVTSTSVVGAFLEVVD